MDDTKRNRPLAVLIARKALFLHVPKTGGLFIQNFVKGKQVGYRHSHINLIGTVAYDSSIFKFCFIRPPDQWYQSYWQMNMKMKPEAPWSFHEPHLLFHPNWEIDPECGSDDLNTFVRNCAGLNGYLVKMYKQYIESNGAKVDFVGRTETLRKDLSTVLDHIGVKHNKARLKKMPKLNQSVKTQTLTEETRLIILNAEREYYNLPYEFIKS